MESSVWFEKYTPKTIEDVILPANIKNFLIDAVNKQKLPNLGFWSCTPGLGKTCTAKALITSMNADGVVLNASLEKGIDVLRSKIFQFASSCSVSGSPKVVVMDESDHITPDAQAAFRGFLDDFSCNCTFIFTGNYKTKMIEPLLNRLQNIDFAEFDKREIVPEILKKLKYILQQENVPVTENTDRNIAEIIRAHYPSIRGMICSLQQIVQENSFDVKIQTSNFDTVIETLRNKDYMQMLQEVNALSNPDSMIEYLYKRIDMFNNVPQAICVLAKYQYQTAFARDKYLNMSACLVELMTCL